MTVGKIAADQMSQKDIEQNKCYVYVREGDDYTPFIVMTAGYDGKALLLRKDVLPKERRMNDGTSYYAGSDIDEWLNGQYLTMLEDAENSPQIQDTEILITADEAIGYSGNETESIVRKVFLLSNAELGFDTSVNVGTEGEPLDYFRDGNITR